ncbi:uncharacterized protein LDX57_009020 [Aspergillus melleus]|uniref:uncharacterized protein n=1 Tax=Aspergillus melleus TaxID=138277 RepID=UPI001E8E3441|nr:uncharacterized protein LDX57_009020 [Aspergillus melleus]KAH8431362.1 hypothetical protein LDX57_009020 [Aspergillus melleus]
MTEFPDIPALPKCRQIWQDVQALEAEGEVQYLKARLAKVKLFLEYVEELDRQKQKHHPRTAKEYATTEVCGAERGRARERFHDDMTVGARWWWAGCFLGLGFILICSEETGNTINDRSFELDPLMLYILYNCGSILDCCSKFDGLVDGLLANDLSTNKRNFPKQISKKEVEEWIKDAEVTNQETVPAIHWEAWDLDAAVNKASMFLSARSSTQS